MNKKANKYLNKSGRFGPVVLVSLKNKREDNNLYRNMRRLLLGDLWFVVVSALKEAANNLSTQDNLLTSHYDTQANAP